MGVVDEVLRERKEKRKKKGRRKAGNFWSLEEVVGIKSGKK